MVERGEVLFVYGLSCVVVAWVCWCEYVFVVR